LCIEGENYKINQAISASGSRYTKDDGRIVFWEHQREAMVEIYGKVVYKNCKLKE